MQIRLLMQKIVLSFIILIGLTGCFFNAKKAVSPAAIDSSAGGSGQNSGSNSEPLDLSSTSTQLSLQNHFGTDTYTSYLSTPVTSPASVTLKDGTVLVAGGAASSNGASLANAQIFNPSTGTWTAVGSLNFSRSDMQAVLLQDGTVLIAGGTSHFQNGPWTALSSAEIYDPTSKTWSVVGNLRVPRNDFTLTLLKDGTVLAVGGGGISSEVYDPNTKTWTTVGNLSTSRNGGHAATLLNDGTVLVAGGFVTAASEIYDPNSQTWSTVGDLNTARQHHSMVLLKDGTVLAIGGQGAGFRPYVSCEVYDPKAQTWTAVGDLTVPRYGHTTNLLDGGTVMVSGGNSYLGNYNVTGLYTATTEIYDPQAKTWSTVGSMSEPRTTHASAKLSDGKIFVTGGTGDGYSSEIYDPQSQLWTPVGDFYTARVFHSASLLQDGKVLIAGGSDVYGNSTGASYTYDRESKSWSPAGVMNTSRSNHTSTLLNDGTVLVAGGTQVYTNWVSNSLSSAEIYDPIAKTWTATAAMSVIRSQGHTATLLKDGTVLVVGGNESQTTSEIYDPFAKSWTPVGNLNFSHSGHAAVLMGDGKVLVVGGRNLAVAEIYDPGNQTWTSASSMSVARLNPSSVLLKDGTVLVAAGNGGAKGQTPLSSCEIYNPQNDSWTPVGSMAFPRRNNSLTLLADGTVLAIGGQDASHQDLLSSEIYDPVAQTWSTAASLPTGHYNHSATLLADGTVFVFGGRNSMLGTISLPTLFTHFDSTLFTAAGGTPDYTYSFSGDQNRGKISSSGLFIPFTTGSFTVIATDSKGRTGKKTVTVTAP